MAESNRMKEMPVNKLMVQMGISVEDVLAELASRHVIDKKVKQEKMTE